MDLLWAMFCFSCLTVSSPGPGVKATQCKDNQHCSDCDSISGHCIIECDPGYYDQKCSSVCNENCKNNTCVISISGSGNCTNGCVPGYQGTSCNIPCDSPGGNCTACPGGCDGGYCQLGSSCVSGCEDSYYGTGCKNCSSGCPHDEGRYSTYLNLAVVTLSLVCVFCACTTVVAQVLKMWHTKREAQQEEVELEYHRVADRWSSSPDTFRQTDETYSEVHDNDMGRVVVFL
ncbi:multiple epidermal growth factor-like domains protein 10 [Haliotis rufescens]|uniref:multiple epidermal growth factor-like domains protein 10 n=1 Tax=Haliotis rufescens TaxID=6454 RepID=UPI00201FB3AF|nr:multiple epidermal growth factor-like domains protein 10 [Haliotis rufescens]WPV87677.1 multiple EGF-like domains 10 [Haliotis discus hannai]